MNYFIKTYGCQMNQSDSTLIDEILSVRGMRWTSEVSQADILVINTCSVRAHAERRASGFISTLLKWKNECPSRILCVCGCMSQRRGSELIERFPWIDIIVGPDRYQKLPDYIGEIKSQRTKICDLNLTGELYCNVRPSRIEEVTAYVSIMRGCDNFCSFCIVPYLRGRARSKDIKDVLEEINFLVDRGIKEVTLLGQNVNAYRSIGVTFADLLEKVNEISGLLRIRFLTSHPADMNERMLKAINEFDKVCEYIHLPFQSGSDRLLRLMNRRYTNSRYREIVDTARHLIPKLGLSTDVIVGFPTETDADYEATKKLMVDICLLYTSDAADE